MKNRTRMDRLQWQDAVMDSNLAGTTKLVLIALARFGNAKGEQIFPRNRSIAKKADRSVSCVSEHINLALREGWLERHNISRDPQQLHWSYTLTFPIEADLHGPIHHDDPPIHHDDPPIHHDDPPIQHLDTPTQQNEVNIGLPLPTTPTNHHNQREEERPSPQDPPAQDPANDGEPPPPDRKVTEEDVAKLDQWCLGELQRHWRTAPIVEAQRLSIWMQARIKESTREDIEPKRVICEYVRWKLAELAAREGERNAHGAVTVVTKYKKDLEDWAKASYPPPKKAHRPPPNPTPIEYKTPDVDPEWVRSLLDAGKEKPPTLEIPALVPPPADMNHGGGHE